MSIAVVSSVPAYGNGAVTSGSYTIVAPNLFNYGFINIGSVIGLQAALDAKLNDVLTAVGTNVISTGNDLNLLNGTAAYGLVTADLQKLADISVSAIEINRLSGVTSNVQTQLNSKIGFTLFTAADDIFAGTGVGTGGVVAFLDVLNNYAPNQMAVATADLSLGNHKLTNVTDPTGLQDAATKNYVDNIIGGGGFLPRNGSLPMTGNLDLDGRNLIITAGGFDYLDGSTNNQFTVVLANSAHFRVTTTAISAFSKPITSVVDPTNAQDAATKNYVDNTTVSITGDTMIGALDMDGNDIILTTDGLTRLENGTNGVFDVIVNGASHFQVTPTAINAQSKKISGVAAPAAGTDAVNLTYADATYLAKAGGTMTGTLNMGGQLISGPGAPSAGTHVGDRDYNDARYLRISQNLADLASPVTARTNLGLATVASTGAYADLIGAPTPITTLDSLTDVNVGTPGLGQNGYVLRWNNGGSVFDLAPAPVVSVFGRTGTVVATNGDYTAANITNVAAGNIAATNVQAALNELDTEKLAIAGGTMSGNINMNSNNITNIGSLTVTNHAFTSADYRSGLGGNSFLIRTTNAPTVSTPSYSFLGSQTSGMYWDGAQIAFSVGGVNKMNIGASTIDATGNRIINVGTPTGTNDAVNLSYLKGLNVTRVLGTVSGINLMTGAGTATPIYTLPSGVMHVITKVIVVATSYIPGISPVDAQISVGITGPDYNQIIDTATLSWGVGGAADQAVYVEPDQGASTPNAANVVYLQKDTLASGTFSALTVKVYVLGFEA